MSRLRFALTKLSQLNASLTTPSWTFIGITGNAVAIAGLYTLRIISGASAASAALSFLLLLFWVFLFLSLSLVFVKRYAELDG